MSGSEDQNIECPLCMEPLEMDDISFFPCTCGYQICRFCWHRIRTDENGLCPACRKQYPEDPADFKPLTSEQLLCIKNEKRQKDMQRKQRKQKISENRKHLANVRVVQKNLVFVVGLSARLAEPEVLKKNEYFGKFGKVHKVVINHTTGYVGSQGQSASAYVTYNRSEDALRAIQAVNNIQVDGRTLKASLGTTKYCSHFLKNQHCPKSDCMYLHDLGDEAASFTKDEMQQGKHQEYEKRLHELLIASAESCKTSKEISRKGSISPNENSPQQMSPGSSGESWPSLQNGETSGGVSSSTNRGNKKSQNRTSNGSNDGDDPTNVMKGSGDSSNDGRRSRNASGDDQCHSHKSGRDRLSESSQSSSSPSPIQESGESEETWPTISSPSSESDTETGMMYATSDYRTISDLNKDKEEEVIQQRPNGLSQGLHEALITNSGVHSNGGGGGSTSSNIPPRFQNSQGVHRNKQGSSNGLLKQQNNYTNNLHHPQLKNLSNASSATLAAVNKVLQLDQNTNPNHSFFSSVSGLRNPSALQQQQISNGSSEWPMNGIERTLLTSSDTLPVNTSTDWQAAFGFGPSQHQRQTKNCSPASVATDDDLGFDPWNESTKGLADLIAIESNPTSNRSTSINGVTDAGMPWLYHHNAHTNMNNDYSSMPVSTGSRRVGAPPGFSTNQLNNYCSNGGMMPPSSRQSHVPPYQNGMINEKMMGLMMGQHNHHLQNGRNSSPYINGMKPNNQQLNGIHKPPMLESNPERLKGWQAELRAMLPNINISFSSNPTHFTNTNNIQEQIANNQIGSSSSISCRQQQPLPDRTDSHQQWMLKSLHQQMANNGSSPSNDYPIHDSVIGGLPNNAHHRLSLAAAQQYAFRVNQQWGDSNVASQMVPGFSPSAQHLLGKHNEQSLLENLPGVM